MKNRRTVTKRNSISRHPKRRKGFRARSHQAHEANTFKDAWLCTGGKCNKGGYDKMRSQSAKSKEPEANEVGAST